MSSPFICQMANQSNQYRQLYIWEVCYRQTVTLSRPSPGELEKLSLFLIAFNSSGVTRTFLVKGRSNFFNACVVSKLLYSLETLCLRKADQAGVDAFQAQSLRKIFKIPHSMFSHISNQEVRRIAGEYRLSQTVLYRQLCYFGKIARATEESELRSLIFHARSIELRPLDGTRNVGRPRLRWESVVYAHAIAAAQTLGNLSNLIYNPNAWHAAVRIYSLPC